MDEGTFFLKDDFDRIVLGDQHHAEAVDVLRQARDRSWVLVIEAEPSSFQLFTSIHDDGDGAVFDRMATMLYRAARHYGGVAQQVAFQWFARRATGQEIDIDPPNIEDE